MIPYGRQSISQADIDAVISVLNSDWLTQGPVVPKFEQAVADYCGARFGIAVNSATSALHIACLSLDVGPGDLVWVPANTFVATANCALYCGADVDFIDIDSQTYNISVECLRQKLVEAQSKNALPKVVIPVHFAGQSSEMLEISKLSKEFGFKVIEDASHALGGEYLGKRVGSCDFSDITVLSFHPVKMITTGEGGMVLTNDGDLAAKLVRNRTHGITSSPNLMEWGGDKSDEIWNFQQVSLGFNFRLTDIQAALGLSQMERLSDFLERRREIAKKYDQDLAEIGVVLPFQDPTTNSSRHLYPIRLLETSGVTNQRLIYNCLIESGIMVNLHYIPVYRHPYFERIGFKKGYCPEAELYFKSALSIPIFPSLTNLQQEFVIDRISHFLNKLKSGNFQIENE
jgi:UDP-4-amino-4,6-dideoxy-N-acetyl-beta-L-altrosamine transaminase